MARAASWKERFVDLLARRSLEFAGRPVSMRLTSIVLEQILDDPELEARLDALDEDGIRREFLRLYAEAARSLRER